MGNNQFMLFQENSMEHQLTTNVNLRSDKLVKNWLLLHLSAFACVFKLTQCFLTFVHVNCFLHVRLKKSECLKQFHDL